MAIFQGFLNKVSKDFTVPGDLYMHGGQMFLDAQNAGIEIGSTTISNTPYMDYHSSGFNNDYDVRTVASGGSNGTNGNGTLNIEASQVQINGSRLIKDGATYYVPNTNGTAGGGTGYQNGFKDWSDNTYKLPIVTRMDSNLVIFEGLIYMGTPNSVAFTLSTVMQPSGSRIFACYGSKGYVYSVWIASNGQVSIDGGATGDWVSLSGISYIP